MGFLGVSNSLNGRRWVGPDPGHDRAAEQLMQQNGLSPALSQVLARLGVEPGQTAQFLDPKLRDLMPDPMSLRDMGKASDRIAAAIRGSERIAIFADYDVDGGSSAAILSHYCRHFGINATIYVPDRIDEGYGPNAPAMQVLSQAHDLIICVDCGTLSHDALAAATVDVIVLDHHLGGETLPPVLAVVNPNRQDETGDLAHLCAAAVVFVTLAATQKNLRADRADLPDLMGLLDLVGLATVADVAPLQGVNRAFVRQGLRVMANRQRIGLVALADQAGIDSEPSAYHLGYVLGPRINAGGRIGAADMGARLLATTDPAKAAKLAQKLDQLNLERRAIEADIKEAALAQAEARGLQAPLAWAADDGWHAGVVGIVAARLKEATNRPAVVIGFDGEAGKGSARSVPGIDLGSMIQRLAHEGLIEKGGGHKMAAGLSLSRAQLEPAMARLSELMAAQGAGDRAAADLTLDGALMPAALRPELIDELDRAGPFGAGAPAPRFALPDMPIQFVKEVGKGHLKLTVGPRGNAIDAIAFGAFDSPMGLALRDHAGQNFHLAGRLEINHWGGRRKVQLQLSDAAPAH